MARTLTSANSVILIGVLDLFPVPQQLQGFSTDDIFSSDGVESAETMMGVDGKLSAGWVPTVKKTTFSLQGDSLSNDFFDAWFAGQEAQRELFRAFSIIRVPGLGKSFALTGGYLKSYVPINELKKTTQPRKFGIDWETIIGAPI